MGMFGSSMVADLLRKVPIAGGTPPVFNGDYASAIQPTAPDMQSIAASASPLAKKPGFFGTGTPARAALGGLLDSILTMTGGQAINTPYLLAQKQRRLALEDEQRKRTQELEDAIKLAEAKAKFREPSALEQNFAFLNQLKPGLGDEYARNFGQPDVTITLPGNRVYSGPRSGLAAALGGVSSGPQPGVIEDGYQFIGGNPGDPKNWRKVQ